MNSNPNKRMNLFFILILFFLAQNSEVIGQQTIFIGTKNYPSTDDLIFDYKRDGQINQSVLTLVVAKTSSSGAYLILTSDEAFVGADDNFTGTVLLYLADNTVISCYDRNMKDNVDGTFSSIYTLTQQEIEKLKKVEITTIRFSATFGGLKSSSTATNCNGRPNPKDMQFHSLLDKNTPPNIIQSTSESISKLFSNN